MSEPFLITGLPRSRTAWFAAAAMNDQSVCYHEPLRRLSRWDDVFYAVWNGYGIRYVGASDHALGFWLPEIMRREKPRTLIIERPIGEVNASLARIGFPPTNFCELLLEYLSFDHPAIMRVPYAALDDAETVMCCLRHLMPDAKISIVRIRELQTLNIQANIAASIASGFSRAHETEKFFPADMLTRLRAT